MSLIVNKSGEQSMQPTDVGSKEMGVFKQRDDEKITYQVDYSAWLADSETILTATYAITPDTTPLALVENNEIQNGNVLLFNIDGGLDNTKYLVAVTINTSLGQKKIDYFFIKIGTPSIEVAEALIQSALIEVRAAVKTCQAEAAIALDAQHRAENAASVAVTAQNNAASSASDAAGYAANARASAILSGNYAANSANSAASSATSATNAENSYQSLHNQYYGPLSSEPATRPNGSPRVVGDLYFDTNILKFRVWNGGVWGVFNGGATGGGLDEIFWLNNKVVTEDFEVAGYRNAGTWGPVTINNGVTVDISDDSTWTVM